MNAGRADEALQYLKNAYEFNPKNYEAGILYLVALIYQGDREVERAIINKFLDNGDYFLVDPRIMTAYESTGRISDAIARWRKEQELRPETAAMIQERIDELLEKMR